MSKVVCIEVANSSIKLEGWRSLAHLLAGTNAVPEESRDLVKLKTSSSPSLLLILLLFPLTSTCFVMHRSVDDIIEMNMTRAARPAGYGCAIASNQAPLQCNPSRHTIEKRCLDQQRIPSLRK
jgi:hypothetical protein